MDGAARSREVRVGPVRLDRIAVTCDSLYDRVREAVAAVPEASGTAARAIPGAAMSAALSATAEDWAQVAPKAIGRFFTRFGAALEQCANDYRHSDHASAERFNKVTVGA